jgi:trk system potassium uptake protein TrkH
VRFVNRLFQKIIHRFAILSRWFKRSAIHQVKYAALKYLRSTYRVSNTLTVLITLMAIGLIIYDFGYYPFYSHEPGLYHLLGYILWLCKAFYTVRFMAEWVEIKKWKAHVYNFLLVVFIFYLASGHQALVQLKAAESTEFLIRKSILYIGISFLFLTEASNLLKFVYQRRQNPAFVFIISFAVIILFGTLLLLLPNATTHGISLVNALFTSASAVCVTGLTVVDTATAFTPMGKVILLFLIQIGGLGIMTFTGLLGYLSAGSFSFHNQMALRSMVSSNRISNVIMIITRIITVTLFFEVAGALVLYATVNKELFHGNVERIFFVVFHSVSAFCNAGFSTESAGLFSEHLRFNYPLHLVIAVLVILGGMGFPIVFNIFTFIRIKAMRMFDRFVHFNSSEPITRILQVNSKLAITTTLLLLAIGFITFFVFEYNASLRDHATLMGKITTAFFGSVTPRTAGFNTVDMTRITLPMIMFYLLLMWIGASPVSTGGGIKTTTAAVAFLNMRSIALGRKRTEVFRTQISAMSIRRAFAVMILSLLVIGLTVLIISICDGEKGLLKIAFESFSAFSTVGLTLGITPELSPVSKVVLVFTMFIGRVGALTVLTSFISQAREQAYQYPEEEIQF